MRILLLGFNKKKRSYTVKRLVSELKKRGHTVTYMSWRGLVFSFDKKGASIKRINGPDLKYYDYIIPKYAQMRSQKDDSVRASDLYRHYFLVVKYINHYHKHALNEKTTKKLAVYDKLFEHYLLANSGIPVIPTRLYTGKQLPPGVYDKFKKPYVVKSIQGLAGKQVFLIQKKSQVKELVARFGIGKLLVQKYIPVNQDYRILVLGDKVIGGMKRTAPGDDFRTNVSIGGNAERAQLSKEIKELAIKAAKAFDAEFAGVDILKYKGKYYVLEVNIFPGFEGFERATGINVAEELASYIEKKYLWSIETDYDEKDKKKIFAKLYNIEKENLEGPPLTEEGFMETLLQRELIVINKEKRPIAYLTHYKKDGIRRITRYGIIPKYRGQRVGRRMLRALIQISEKGGDYAINAVIPAENRQRQNTFKRMRFKKTDYVLKDRFGKGHDAFVYEYTIKPGKKTRGPGLTKGKVKGKK